MAFEWHWDSFAPYRRNTYINANENGEILEEMAAQPKEAKDNLEAYLELRKMLNNN